MSTKTAYPLCWPAGWPATDSLKREQARFKTTLAGALSNLRKNVEFLGGKNLILSSNYTLSVERPKNPGVVAYFDYQEMQVAIPCDRWTLVEHNVQAISLTIEAMRGMERWGAKHMIKAMFTGFKALPAPSLKNWYEVLGVRPDAKQDQIDFAFKNLCKVHHPDVGGSNEKMVEINLAYNYAKSTGRL